MHVLLFGHGSGLDAQLFREFRRREPDHRQELTDLLAVVGLLSPKARHQPSSKWLLDACGFADFFTHSLQKCFGRGGRDQGIPRCRASL